MGTSVGQIDLDLEINQKGFNKQLIGIEKTAKRAGLVIAAAFGVKKLVDFGKQCLELGSDLAEVQNVVDVAFPKMSKQIDDFAKNAISKFGLSETMAKRFTGTFGAMSRSFGFTEEAAAQMGTTLTGLAGDVASFYNISQDMAYTKLKSVFTGETESLKDLSVVMTQTALDAFALSNGFGKTTKSMSEAEKVALRYAFIQDKLKFAIGDFARTSDSWANQTRILKLQFDSLKATLGQGLINVLTPVIKVINTLMSKLIQLAGVFKSFTEMITGKSGAVAEMNEVAEAADNAADSTGAMSDSAKSAAKSAKAAQKSLMGFDEINKLNEKTDSGSDIGEVPSVDLGTIDFGKTIEQEEKKASKAIDALKKKLKELADLFKKGFKIGLGDDFEKSIDRTKEHLIGIKNSLSEIVTDKKIIKQADNLANSIALSLGKVSGSVVSIGQSVAENFIGGFDKYLSQNKGFIKDRIESIFKSASKAFDNVGDLSVAFADIFEVFRGDTAKQITSDLIGIFANAGLGIIDITAKIGSDIIESIAKPIINNKDKIKEALENTFKPISTVLSAINDIVKNSFEKVFEVYEQYVEPAFNKFADGLNTIFSGALGAYNKYLVPVLNWIAERFAALSKDYIQPLIDSFLELAGSIIDALATVWNFLSPFIAWFVEKFIAVLATKLQWVWTVFELVFGIIATILTGFMDMLKGFIDFLVGVFTGDWKKAWNGIKSIFSGIWDTIKGIVKAGINFIGNTIATVLTAVKNSVSVILDGIAILFKALWETIKNIFSLNTVKGHFTSVVNSIKSVFSTIQNWFKSKFTDAWNGIMRWKIKLKKPILLIENFMVLLIYWIV